MSRAPLVPVMGNHDKSKLGYFRRFFVTELASDGRRYFARDWGDLRLVLVDSEEEYRQGSSQYEFLDQQLAEAAREGMFIVMATHEPPYSSGKHGSNLMMRKTVSRLARRYGVELVVSGHDHNYERTKPMHGVTYVVSGSAGAPIRPVDPQSFSAKTRLEPHYVLVDVEPRGLTLRAVNLKGDTFDSFVIRPNPPLNPQVTDGR
jgi:3',5'-cyclic AMP phosphodiesterase CpdA